MKKLIMPALLAVSSLVVGAGPAFADHEGIAIYRTTMYSDATKTTVVGTIELSYCTYYFQTDGAQYHLEGTYTMHQSDELIGYCAYGDFGPIH
jgi:hypothetical protein